MIILILSKDVANLKADANPNITIICSHYNDVVHASCREFPSHQKELQAAVFMQFTANVET